MHGIEALSDEGMVHAGCLGRRGEGVMGEACGASAGRELPTTEKSPKEALIYALVNDDAGNV